MLRFRGLSQVPCKGTTGASAKNNVIAEIGVWGRGFLAVCWSGEGGGSNTSETSSATKKEPLGSFFFGIGSTGRARTCDPAVNSRLLYQLSYCGINFFSTWVLAVSIKAGVLESV